MSTMERPWPRLADDADRARYYEAAMRALQFVERRSPTGRRFGADADARWGAFRGNLTTADRMDLLLRDADAQWPSSFGARNVFALRAAAEDEAFGAEWLPMDPVDAEELWRRVIAEPPPSAVKDALVAAAATWELKLAPVETAPVGAAEKLIVAGPSAIATLIGLFATGSDLDWADQVIVVATPPAHRQLAALAGALLNATKPSALMTPDENVKVTAGRRLVLSADAAPEDAAWAKAHAVG
ncbi:MAG: hypothetical protein HOW73_18150 [Polyangiaceae bacterium]|nr:hypothetical protein [Polyangiaceae bacterium]